MRGVVVWVVLVAGCTAAHAPPQGPSTTAASAKASATGGATTNAGAPASDAAGREVNHSLVAQGYKPTNYRGQLFYCRKEKLTGSQFTQRVCITEQEAALQERIAQDEMTKRGSQGKCVPPLCPNH